MPKFGTSHVPFYIIVVVPLVPPRLCTQCDQTSHVPLNSLLPQCSLTEAVRRCPRTAHQGRRGENALPAQTFLLAWWNNLLRATLNSSFYIFKKLTEAASKRQLTILNIANTILSCQKFTSFQSKDNSKEHYQFYLMVGGNRKTGDSSELTLQYW